jgi:hypothetical protein
VRGIGYMIEAPETAPVKPSPFSSFERPV